jgi:hypothetical protein
MEARLLPGQLWRESEFVYDRVAKRWLTGTCGPNALAMAESWASQSYSSTLDTYYRLRLAHRCAPNGAATLAALAQDTADSGYRSDQLPYREPMPELEWRAFCTQHAGKQAIVLEVARGQLLVDSISGQGENARDLRYHFIVLMGWHPGGHCARMNHELPPGWWCSDGDNFAKGNVLQFYPDSVLLAAGPCAALAVYAQVPGASLSLPAQLP